MSTRLMVLKKYGFVYLLTGITAAITLPITIFMLTVGLVTFDKAYYYKEYTKYGIAKAMNLEVSDLKKITNNTLDYLIGRQDHLDFKVRKDLGGGRDFFSERDKAHMVDVKNIYTLLRNVGIVAGIFFGISVLVILRRPALKENIHRFLGTGAILGIVPFVALGILMLMDFNKYFILFHEKFFANDLWLLDPAVDNLVNIFPEGFFMDMALRICGGYIIGLLAVIVLSLSTITKIRRNAR